MNPKLKQARKGQTALINEDPTSFIVYTNPMTTDPLGNIVEDPYGVAVESAIKARISHEWTKPEQPQEVPSGFTTNLNRFITSDYLNVIAENQTFEALGKTWKIGPVDPLTIKSGIYGYQAPLKEAD